MRAQIIHTFEGFLSKEKRDGMAVLLGSSGELGVAKVSELLQERLSYLKECGLDGLVVNVGGEPYLEDEESWELLRQGLAAARSLGFKIWLYDEKGYPSGSAGGLVLREESRLEAVGIKREREDYYLAPLYEGTHAERNYSERRRYINLLDSKAVERFLAVTHNRYKEKLGKDMELVEAFFTDEPSLMSVVLPQLEGPQGKQIPVLDPPDPAVKVLPALPYSEELANLYKQRWGQELLAAAPQLMRHSQKPSAEKCAFWETVAMVYEQTYAERMQAGCAALGTKLTGHILAEESLFANMVFHANPFRVLKHFHLPGVDLLTNKIDDISIFGHKLPLSCAFLNHEGWIMTETSDFVEDRIEGKPASAEQMAAALSYQFLLGVREFTYYYNIWNKEQAEYRWINQLLARMCGYAENWKYMPSIALYCPYESFWAGYVPASTPLPELLEGQPEFVQQTEKSILRLCDKLFSQNQQFILCDESSVDDLGKRGITHLVLPEAPVVANAVVEAALEGRVSLYGGRPSLVYKDGELADCPQLSIKPLSELPAPEFPQASDLRYSAFQDRRYYFFNPSWEVKALTVEEKAVVYDPAADHKLQVEPATVLTISGGSGLFVCFGD